MPTITHALRDLGFQIIRHSSPALPLYDALEPSHVFLLASLIDRVRPVLIEVSRDTGNGRFDFWGPDVGGGEPLYGEVKQAWIEEEDAHIFGDDVDIARGVNSWAEDVDRLNSTSDISRSVHCAFVLFLYGKGHLPRDLNVAGLPTADIVPRLSWDEANNLHAALGALHAETAIGAVNELFAVAQDHHIRVGSALTPPVLETDAWIRPGEYGRVWLLPIAMEWIRDPRTD